MGNVINSGELGTIEVKVVFDLSGTSPVINLTNQTTANPNISPIPLLNDLIWVLNIFSPTGTQIFQSDFTTPWITGLWTNQIITAAWPRPFGEIEWSGADYLVQFQVKDNQGNIYNLNKNGTLCRPTGNTPKIGDAFGHVDLSVEVLCDKAELYIQDNTAKTYRGIVGILNSGYLVVDYPRDPTGVRPPPFEVTSFLGDALIPFNYNGNGYEATTYSIYTYDLGNNVFVIIRYVGQVDFPVQCNIDLCPIACEIASLEDSIKNGTCDNAMEAQKILGLVTPMLLRAFIAKSNPTCGMDLPALIDEIKAIGGFQCDCYGANTGIGTQSALLNGLLFSVNNQGGDVVASFSVVGNNVILNVKDKSYTFGSCAPVQTTAISLKSTTNGTTTNVCLNVSVADLAADLYNTTASNTYLLNLFNSLVLGAGGGLLTVDGKCVISSGACNYTFTLSNIPAGPSNAILTGILSSIDGNVRNIKYAFNLSTLVALQTYLNTLGVGVFTVTNPSGSTVLISTNTNNFSLTGMVYIVGAVSLLAVFTSNCTGFIALTPTQLIQAIINYLCGLTDAQVTTSAQYAICYIDPVSKTEKTSTIASGSELNTFITELIARGCDTISYIMSIAGVSCAAIQNLFGPSDSQMQPNDYLLGTKNGGCARIYPVELGTILFQYGISNAAFMAAFAAAINLNAGGNMCEAYSVFNIAVVEDSPIDNKLKITVTFTHPSAIANLIRYARIDQGGALNWSVPVSVLPGGSPYTTPSIDDGQYRVGITPVYADGRKCAEITQDTNVCGAIIAFSAALNVITGHITVTYTATSAKVKVVINQPNGGVWSQIYTNGASIDIVPAGGLTGDFYVSMIPVCNSTTNWNGPATAPSVITINPANNSALKNITSSILGNVYVTAYNINGGNLVLLVPSMAVSAIVNFYLADGFYNQITVVALSGGKFTGTLSTGSGSYPFVAGAFTNVTASGGVNITLIDSSP